MRFVIIGILLLFSNLALKADFVFDSNCQKAYESCLSLRFTESETYLKSARRTHPHNGIILLVESYREFLESAVTESSKKQKDFLIAYSSRIERLDKLSNSSPWKLYIHSEILLQAAFIHFFNQDFFRAAYIGHKAFRILEKNQRVFPDFIPNLKMLGVIHVALGSVPDDFAWAIKVFNVKGSINLGMTELSKLFEQTLINPDLQFLRNEALFYLCFSELQFRKNIVMLNRFKGFFQSSYFSDQYKRNPILTYIYASLLIKLKMNDDAIELLEQRSFPQGTFPLHFLDYYTGECKLNRLDVDASIWFQNFLTSSPTQTYIKSAWQKLAWNALLRGDTSNYRYFISRIKSKGSLITESDKQAFREASLISIPEINLLKARLLFDGAYYERAANTLAQFKAENVLQSPENLLEYYYRLGRIYHESGDFKKAEQYYQIVISTGSSMPQYYAANSALQMGLMLESTGDNKRAISFYRQCLTINPDEYRTGIHQKAKAGINRLQQ